MKKLALLFSIIFLLNHCTTDNTPLVTEKARGNTPWVFRSVLDQMPRIITMALDSTTWVAYHTDKAALYKVWDGGVSFEGAVYDYAHGPQPSSWGYAHTINDYKEPWSVNQGGKQIKPQIEYRGHRFKDNRVHINYDLTSDELPSPISISESPEIITNEKGERVFNRNFSVNGLAKGAVVELALNVGSIIFGGNISTNGKWALGNEKSTEFESKAYVQQDGVLSLTNGDHYFDVVMKQATIADPNLVEATLVEDSGAPLGLKLIAKNDCKTCHNTKVKTIGPAYISVAKKYQETEANINMLVSKVKLGGTGIWGNQIMNAHPTVADSDLKEMVSYILGLAEAEAGSIGEEKIIEEWIEAKSNLEEGDLIPGSITKVWDISKTKNFPRNLDSKAPSYSGILPNFDNLTGNDFKNLDENFAMISEGYLWIEKEGKYSFRTWSDDGSLLYFHGKKVIDNDGNHGTNFKEVTLNMKEGYHPFTLEYFQGGGGKFLSLNYKGESAPAWAVVPVQNIYHTLAQEKTMEGKSLDMSIANKIPGDKNPLTKMHPSFDVSQAKPYEFTPKVGGLDLLSDGTVVVSTWDAKGAVYLVKNSTAGDPDDITFKEIASGFAEPLGIKVVNDEIYVMQKQELTKLIDHDGDEIIDEYQTVCDDWGVTANFHEFGFGLEHKDGHFYATLATGILPGGASMPNQHPNRGNAIKIAEDGSSIEFVASGLRTPNGIGVGFEDEIFVADNQGDWLPASKIVHISKDAWFGSRSVDFEGTANKVEKKPVVWLPQDEIGNSPSTPSYINVGPYKGQMIHGEVTHGGIKRVFVEKVEGEYQGAVFRFIQGLDAGVNRIRWAPDGSLYAGGIGNPGNWGQTGKKWFGLQRMVYNEKSTFEMLAVRAKSNGVEIELTEPIKDGEGWNTSDYEVKQWYYKPTIEYGGPKIDERSLRVRSVHISDDRKKVFLELNGMKENHVVHIRIKKKFVSESNQSLWTTEAWYTLNKIPSNLKGFSNPAPADLAGINELSPAEKKAGWELLFDGKSMSNFRNFKKETIGKSWIIKDQAIHLNAVREEGKWQAKDGGDIITKDTYENFELRLEWKVGNCGNSGVFFNVVENEEFDFGWQTGPEMQILDNVCHPDTRYPTHRAGDLYDMKQCEFVTVNPAGEWNRAAIISNKGAVEFWLNGYKVVDFTMYDESWSEMIGKSKFKDWEGYGMAKSGHISLQDHGDPIWFRNIKIKKL